MSKKAFNKIMAGARDALADIRGEHGHVTRVTTYKTVDAKAVREKTGLSQEEFARTYGVPLDTMRKWEQGKRGPSDASLLLLHLIDRHPKTVLKVAKEVRQTRAV